MKLPASVAASVALSGCAVLGPVDWSSMRPSEPPPPYQDAQRMALSAIQRTLIDPESMRIREESWTPLFASVTDYLDREPVWSICVDVNAKNRIGGYTGFQTWIVNILHGAPTSSDAAHGPTGPDGRGECRHGPADPARVFATPT